MAALPTRGDGVRGPAGAVATTPNGMFVGPLEDPDRYELMGTAVAGGEGLTWPGRYRGRLASPVGYAVKALTPPSDGRPWPTPADVERWRDHRHLLQTVHHDHLVQVHDIFLGAVPHPGTSAAGLPATVPFVVMEWVDGPTLREAWATDAGPLLDRLRAVRQLAGAAAALHSATATSGNPLLHRDIKPENCILHAERGAVLVDIGSLRRLDDGYDPDGPHTRHYTAPEVLEDLYAPREVASDLYGLGAVAYFAVTGDDPPEADEPGAPETIRNELTAALRRAGVRRATVVHRLASMLDADPRRRPSRPLVWIDEVIAGCTPRRRPPWWTAGMGAAVVASAAAISLATGAASLATGAAEVPARSDVGAFVPFGTSFASFPTVVDGNRLGITPPSGAGRYDHLWGLIAPGDNCVATVEFDARIKDPDLGTDFGYAIAPRSLLDADQPQGNAVQYEWQSAGLVEAPGSYLRPADMPGGAWRWSDVPAVPAPDITQPHHVVVHATGTQLQVTIDGERTDFDLPYVECGGVAVRAWGAPVELTDVQITGS